ncbi:serine/threonine protein kinase [Streptomyces sp. NBC_01591]|uniref:serine/threonine-protein kinase n=1 Tax=Streptomyces sp. NBC_01591 TaxID=2975888 RepID=UPI002DDB15FD|nr:serine/threonine-protein kinase [Streptomyces sp. NBC_01591]WSD67556.1 serine/threonine protein kinase [Streptomyces sp. NBC_01591]
MGDGYDERAGAGAVGVGEGRTVGGRYRLVERLGHGGMGTVWLAWDEMVHRDVAIKEPRVPDEYAEAQRQRTFERMLREARSVASVVHPNVVTLHDVVTESGQPWLVMELVQGRSLADLLEEGTLTSPEAARIGLAVVDALAAVHAAGVLHRDVKPGNVLLAENGRVVLTDFGIAQIEGTTPLTEAGALIGSSEYMAPERVMGLRPDAASDMWSLGVLLYVAAEGWSPFRRSNSITTMLAVRDESPPPPTRAGALSPLITALLHKDPAARPDAARVREALHAVAHPQPSIPTQTGDRPSGRSAAAPAMTSHEVAEPRPWYRTVRGRVITVVAAAAVLAGVVLAIGIPSPGTPEGLPSQWQTVDAKTVRLSLSVPTGYQSGTPGDAISPAVQYQSSHFDSTVVGGKPPDGLQFRIQVYRNPDTADSVPGEGSDNDLAGFYRADGREVRRYALDYHAALGGRPASTLDVQYYERGDKAAGVLSRGLQLKVITKDSKVEYSVHVWVRGPAEEVSGDTPSAFYEKVVAGLRIPDIPETRS